MPTISDFCRSAPILGLLLGAGLLAGCGDGDAGGASAGNGAGAAAGSPQSDGELSAWVEALESGQSTLTLSGVVTSNNDAPRDSAANGDIYRPGLGSGAARRGSNAEGPYALTLYTQGAHEASPDEVVRVGVSLVLPAGAEAGRSYAIASFRDADDDQVQAHVRGDGEVGTLGRQVSGELYLAELGERASAAWRFEATDGRGEEARRVEAEGAVRGLDFTPQREARYEITVNGDSEQYLGRVSIHETPNDYAMSIGNRIVLDVPVGIGAGEYALAGQAGDGVIRTSLMRHDVEEIDGVIRLSERNGVFDAEISLEAVGEDEVQLSGRLEELGFDR